MSRIVDVEPLDCLTWQDGEHGTTFDDGVLWVQEKIAEQPTIEPQRWVPCSERLPEKAEGQYWVCTNTGYQCQCRWTDDVYGLGSNGEWAWKIFDIPQYSHVVAWMSLPEPYKGVET